MSVDAFASVNGKRLAAARLTVSNTGPWICDVDFEESKVSGRAPLRIGDASLSGTIVTMQSGSFGLQTRLQAVRAVVGLPDLLPISARPELAACHAELTPGAEVLVAFLEGDRSQPVVVSHAGVDGPGFVPVSLTLGGKAGAPVARKGDVAQVQLPAATFIDTALGVNTSGSSKVRVES